jgi:hypothetical protein
MTTTLKQSVQVELIDERKNLEHFQLRTDPVAKPAQRSDQQAQGQLNSLLDSPY